jgi:NAD(P)-dependent dehydrogenase (short-subunit alcohol dehydrogenase family)
MLNHGNHRYAKAERQSLFAFIVQTSLTIISCQLFSVLNGVLFLMGLAKKFFCAGKVDYQCNSSKQVVVITGCDTGFGELSSRKLGEMGFRVISGCISAEGAERLKDAVALAVVCDVTSEKDIENLASKIEAYCKANDCKLWGVVNNAGIGNGGLVDVLPMETMRKVMEVNFFGVVKVTKALLPLLKQCKHSRIINISSIAGFLSAPCMAAYDASKHAVEGYAKALRVEMKAWNIHVSNINPGFCRTNIVMGGNNAAKAAWAKVPAELQSHYDFQELEPTDFDFLLEDPKVVVNAIVDALTDVAPPMWYFPGYQPAVLRQLTSVCGELLDLIGMQSVGPQPKVEVVQSLQS